MCSITASAVGAVRENSLNSARRCSCRGVMGPWRFYSTGPPRMRRIFRQVPPAPGLDLLAVDDEARALGDLVVKLPGGHIAFLGVPINAGTSRQLRPLVDTLDQGAANALAACGFGREQILEVANGGDVNG